MIFYRPVYDRYKKPLVHIFVSNTNFIENPDNSLLKSIEYRTFEEYRKLYEQVTPWQCIAPKELGIWESDE